MCLRYLPQPKRMEDRSQILGEFIALVNSCNEQIDGTVNHFLTLFDTPGTPPDQLDQAKDAVREIYISSNRRLTQFLESKYGRERLESDIQGVILEMFMTSDGSRKPLEVMLALQRANEILINDGKHIT